MVAAFPATAAAAIAAASRHNANPKNADDLQTPHRPPLIPAEKDNAVVGPTAVAPRRLRHKEIGSRYLSSYSPSPSSTTSTSYTSSSPSSSLSSRRYASPVTSSRTSTPSALSQSASQKRSHSVDRSRPLSTPRPEVDARPALAMEPSAAARALCTTTRSLSVSFQGESFFYQTSRARAASPSSARKATPERRRGNAGAAAINTARSGDYSENSRPFENHHHRWPAAAKAGAANSIVRSMDFSSEKREPIVDTVRLLQQSMVFDDATRRVSFDGDLSTSSDTESVSSGSNSGAAEFSTARVTTRGINMPARFLQEQSSLSSLSSRISIQPKMGLMKKLSTDITSSSPRSASSPLRGHIRSSSPSRIAASPSRGVASPLRARNGTTMTPLSFGQQANAPSIISFAAEVRRAKKGENRIEEAHLLRLLDNRHLQWRCINARANDVLMQQKLTSEKNLYNAWIAVANMHDSIALKRIKLQILAQNLKLTFILKGQTRYLEEWSKLEREHSSSLSAATEALRASTLRLPVVGGAKADVQKLKDAVGSTVDVMQAMTSSLCSLLTKIEDTSSLMRDIAEIEARERMLLNEARLVLSTIASLHVRLCSLQGHLIQLKREPTRCI